jgi:hypothetical protein
VRVDLNDPAVQAQIRLFAACLGLIAAFAGIVLGIGVSADGDLAAPVRVAGAALLGVSAVSVGALIHWASRSRWRHGTTTGGVSAGELFLIACAAIAAFALLLEPLGVASVLVFPLTFAGLVHLHLRRVRARGR